MSENQPNDHKTTVLDETTGVKHSAHIGLWPFSDVDVEMRIWTGEITIESSENSPPVSFKLRCSGKTRLMKYWKCYRGKGVLQPNDVHYINIKVPEEAIYSSRITLLLNDKPIYLSMHKMPKADEFYWGMKSSDIEKNKKTCSRWEMVDKNLLKNLPSGVVDYIQNEKKQSLRQLVFRTAQPLVYQMLVDLGNHAKKTQERPEYFEVCCESTNVLDGIMEYVLEVLEEKRKEQSIA